MRRTWEQEPLLPPVLRMVGRMALGHPPPRGLLRLALAL